MAKRYSGRAVITVTFNDRSDNYRVSISVGGKSVWHSSIFAPRSSTVAVDSPAAYDRIAHSALSFAESEGVDTHAEHDGRGWHIGRSAATKHVRVSNPSRRSTHASRSAAAKKAAATRKRNARKGR